ncbi:MULTISPECIES: IS256 family transposase [Pasteurellaceae]|uniref:Mutator family transposase n=1 Tax=Pasteurella atlantica TaxID=2827233 RepID=A0AAW8CNP6_9PAST|nr:IS256 family transposase [Pasteurella atlantica]MBR0573853.1 IS256 family transposase [Pasteurella atlantica]MDP8039245.1 IS256 family transposase [Pasteurella atlantica]MDP8041336.1 IS256 family transposase [Pasteurella atlantica]MDP8043472.1 IS256 family transposase [Pasteurella atlantica]MDP8045609.1 IS256 family transposase [Pasteurella atlantica]
MKKANITDQIEALLEQLDSQEDIANATQLLHKRFFEKSLNAELDEHLGYQKNGIRKGSNARNGVTPKTIYTEEGKFSIDTPRDREGTFEPEIIKKRQTRVPTLDSKIIYLYSQGMSIREITETVSDLYGTEVSPTLISRVTDVLLDDVLEWQSRPLDDVYPIVYLDCIVVKVRQDKRVINKAIYLALGINMQGQKELLGLWMSENEGAKFWLGVLTELQNRGVKDILIACVDGLTGFPDAINAVYPKTKIQLCIVHMVRNSMKYVPYKDYKAVARDLKKIYQSATEDEALQELENFANTYDDKYPQISRSWYKHWDKLNTLFNYPEDIRKAIYTTNAIESVNSVIRKVINKRKLFPTDDSAKKVVYLAIQNASKKWTMPIRDWKLALNKFMIEFDDRLADYL